MPTQIAQDLMETLRKIVQRSGRIDRRRAERLTDMGLLIHGLPDRYDLTSKAKWLLLEDDN